MGTTGLEPITMARKRRKVTWLSNNEPTFQKGRNHYNFKSRKTYFLKIVIYDI